MSAVDALQRTLAGEHAALHAYGLLGGRTSQSAEPALYDTLVAGYRVHRERRDHLTAVVVTLGDEPVAAAPAYELPGPLQRPEQVRSTAASVEEGCCTTYAALVAETTGAVREWAVTALGGSALQLVRLGDRPVAFPGAPELA